MKLVDGRQLALGAAVSIAMFAVDCAQLSAPRSRAGPHSDVGNPQVVKRVIVGYLELRREIPSDQSGAYFGLAVMRLLKLFDDWNQPEAIETLASLSSYYLGASGGELYSCVVVRKGQLIMEDLKKQSNAAEGECQMRFGNAKGICFSDEDFRANVATLIHDVDSGRVCSLES